jgi:hypothetical protein
MIHKTLNHITMKTTKKPIANKLMSSFDKELMSILMNDLKASKAKMRSKI